MMLNKNETERGPISESLERAEVLAGDAQHRVVEISDVIEDETEGKIQREESNAIIREKLSIARAERMQAVTLGLVATSDLRGSTRDPQEFSAGIPSEKLAHRALYDHYQLGGLVRALARGEVSVSDFSTICGIAQDSFDRYNAGLGKSNPKNPDERESRDLWLNETRRIREEVSTYRLAADARMLKEAI